MQLNLSPEEGKLFHLLQGLPPAVRPAFDQELLQYAEFLLMKYRAAGKPQVRVPVLGSAKGKYQMAEDFNAPLTDFNDYMPE